jgi:hypothetical protein
VIVKEAALEIARGILNESHAHDAG